MAEEDARIDTEENSVKRENQDEETRVTSVDKTEERLDQSAGQVNDNEDKEENIEERKDKQRENEEDTGEKYDYATSLMKSLIYHDNEIAIDPATIEQLTNGLVEQFLPSLRKTQSTIAQIKDSQQVLVDTVEQENSKFHDCQAITKLESTMAKAKVYHTKLLKLRKEMTALHEKSAKLKRRAVKLQQQKQKEEMNKAQVLEKEYEREKMLTARVATEPPDS